MRQKSAGGPLPTPLLPNPTAFGARLRYAQLCMCVCVRVCVRARARERTDAHTRIHIHIHIHAHTYSALHTHMLAFAHSHTHACLCTLTYTCLPLHTRMHIHMRKYTGRHGEEAGADQAARGRPGRGASSRGDREGQTQTSTHPPIHISTHPHIFIYESMWVGRKHTSHGHAHTRAHSHTQDHAEGLPAATRVRQDEPDSLSWNWLHGGGRWERSDRGRCGG